MNETFTVDEAMRFAIEAHSGMVRKSGKKPYILHPMEAAAIVGTMTCDADVIAAAVLHDVVEDTPIPLSEIETKFGERIAALVSSETEDKRADLPPNETWKIRKTESLQVLHDSNDAAVKILWLGDKLSNMRSFYQIYLKEGAALWNRFHQKDPAMQEWYYRAIAEELAELREFPAYQEYVSLVDKVFSK